MCSGWCNSWIIEYEEVLTEFSILSQKCLSTVIGNCIFFILNNELAISSSHTYLCAEFECSNLGFWTLAFNLKNQSVFVSFILLFHSVELVDSKASYRKFQFMCMCSNYQRLVMFLNNRDSFSQQNFLLLQKNVPL